MEWPSKILFVICMAMVSPFLLLSCHTQKKVVTERMQLDSISSMNYNHLTYTLQLSDTVRYLEVQNGDTTTERIIIRGTKACTQRRDTTQNHSQTKSEIAEIKQSEVSRPFIQSNNQWRYDLVAAVLFLALLALVIRVIKF